MGKFMSPPQAAWLAIATLGVGVPLSLYPLAGVRDWQIGGSPAAALADPYFHAMCWIRSLGAVALAALLLFRQRRSSVAVTLTAVWIAGPPVHFLMRGIDMRAMSEGQVSWNGVSGDSLATTLAVPMLVTLCLIVPVSVRRAYAR